MRRLVLVLTAVLLGGCTAAAAPTPAPTQPAQPADATACGPERPEGYEGWPAGGSATADAAMIPLIVSTQNVVGPSRFLFTLVDDQNQLLASEDVGTEVRLFALGRDTETPAVSETGTFLDSGTGRGLYRAAVDFPCSGDWGVEIEAGLPDGVSTARVVFTVLPEGSTPAIGAPAPQSDSPTANTPDEIAMISTDPEPDPDFYRQTIAQAVTSGKPSMIVFATPAFCQTRTCGPALEVVKDVAADFKDTMTFVNVEPYVLQETANGLQPELDDQGRLQPVPAVLDYGLVTEPYAFVVAADGTIAAKFEGMAGADELRQALEQVTATA
jgi:hypothetical protein